MCGIAGTYHWPDGGALTDRLTETLAHRGPDGAGRYTHRTGGGAGGEVHLGHRRLSIIDLSETGAQPMVSDGLALSYNGELYNAPELRVGVRIRAQGACQRARRLAAGRRRGAGGLAALLLGPGQPVRLPGGGEAAAGKLAALPAGRPSRARKLLVDPGRRH